MRISNLQFRAVARFCSAFLALACLAPAATRAAENEQDLIRVLQSQADGGEKAIACKKLAIYGSAQAVPALAPLLPDEKLSSWARIALEAIPGSAADDALRNALPAVHGRLLTGVINSIAVRRDQKAVEPLIKLLQDEDADVASAAGIALGRIGGNPAAKALQQVLAKGPESVRGAAAEGCIRCAEQLMAQSKASQAAKIYDVVRKAQVPKQQVLDATRGAILSRNDKGVPLLVEQLKSPDKAFFFIGLSTARELPGKEATKAVAQELRGAGPERQPLILLALADRNDPGAMPAIVEAVRTGSPKLRLTGVTVLEKMGNASTVPLLLECASGTDEALAQASRAALVRLHGEDVDTAITQRLPKATGTERQALIEIASRRGVESALPEILKSAKDNDPAVRGAALQAVGALGGSQQVPELARLLKETTDTRAQGQIEEALLAVCGRIGAGCVPDVQALAKDGATPVRIAAIRALAAAGGTEALAGVKTAAADQDGTVQDEAIRTLSSWPNTWPEDAAITEVLLGIAKNDTNPTHQVLAIRGYLQFLQGDRKLGQNEKIEKVSDALPLMQRPEEKRSAIAFVQKIHTPGSLKLLASMTDQAGVADEACSAIVDVAGRQRNGITKEDRQQALQAVVEKCKDDSVKQKAEKVLEQLK